MSDTTSKVLSEAEKRNKRAQRFQNQNKSNKNNNSNPSTIASNTSIVASNTSTIASNTSTTATNTSSTTTSNNNSNNINNKEIEKKNQVDNKKTDVIANNNLIDSPKKNKIKTESEESIERSKRQKIRGNSKSKDIKKEEILPQESIPMDISNDNEQISSSISQTISESVSVSVTESVTESSISTSSNQNDIKDNKLLLKNNTKNKDNNIINEQDNKKIKSDDDRFILNQDHIDSLHEDIETIYSISLLHNIPNTLLTFYPLLSESKSIYQPLSASRWTSFPHRKNLFALSIQLLNLLHYIQPINSFNEKPKRNMLDIYKLLWEKGPFITVNFPFYDYKIFTLLLSELTGALINLPEPSTDSNTSSIDTSSSSTTTLITPSNMYSTSITNSEINFELSYFFKILNLPFHPSHFSTKEHLKTLLKYSSKLPNINNKNLPLLSSTSYRVDEKYIELFNKIKQHFEKDILVRKKLVHQRLKVTFDSFLRQIERLSTDQEKDQKTNELLELLDEDVVKPCFSSISFTYQDILEYPLFLIDLSLSPSHQGPIKHNVRKLHENLPDRGGRVSDFKRSDFKESYNQNYRKNNNYKSNYNNNNEKKKNYDNKNKKEPVIRKL